MVEVIVTGEFTGWYGDLAADEQEQVAHAVDLLEEKGVGLGDPWTSAIKGSRYALRELKVQSRGRPFRILYAFDPQRQAVLIVGGDKTGRDRFYEEMTPWAEAVWEQYLNETGQRGKRP